MKILIGIDTGVHTGFAVAFDHGAGGELQRVESLSITQAMQCVLEYEDEYDLKDITLYIEDARLRTWFGAMDARQAKSGAGVREGVGSVKRDAQIWEDWCKENGYEYLLLSPAAKGAKVDAVKFEKITGWQGRTSQHARDAAMLVYGR